MKEMIRIAFALASLLVGTLVRTDSAFGQLAQGEKDTIYIGPIKVSDSVAEAAKKRGRSNQLNQLAEALRGQLLTELNQTRVFQLVERERKEYIELEQAFSEVAVDPNDPKRAQTMKMMGAKFVFLPRLDGFEDASSAERFQAIGRANLSRSVWATVVVQITDTTTGAILPESPSVKVKKSNSVEYAKEGSSLGGDELIGSLAKELAEKLAQETVALLRPAKVLTVTGSQIMINRGTEAGFTEGTTVEFFATEDVKDEDTGEVFKNEVSVGMGVIARSDAKQSFADQKGENLGIAKGCLVKALKKAAPSGAVASKKIKPEEPSGGSGEKPIQFN
jgi:curli biogenesis system outer membrane secretion channel CsgG